MDIHRGKSGAIECRRHFSLTIDALLSKHGDSRGNSRQDEGRCHILSGVKTEICGQARIISKDILELLVGTAGIVPPPL